MLQDVEAIETLSKQMMYSFVPALTNVLIAIAITSFKSLQVTLFFVLVIPFGVLVMYQGFFSNIMASIRIHRTKSDV